MRFPSTCPYLFENENNLAGVISSKRLTKSGSSVTVHLNPLRLFQALHRTCRYIEIRTLLYCFVVTRGPSLLIVVLGHTSIHVIQLIIQFIATYIQMNSPRNYRKLFSQICVTPNTCFSVQRRQNTTVMSSHDVIHMNEM